MAVFVAFSDESAVADPSGEFLVSGHVADEEEWPWVAAAWQERVLDGPPRLPYLHMREIRSEEWRQRHKISFNDAEERVSEAVRILYSMGAMSAICSVIKQLDLREVIHSGFKRKKHIPIGLDEPDYFCFIAYAFHVLREVRKRYPHAERVNFIVSRKNKVTEHYKAFLETMKDYFDAFHPELMPLVGDLTPACMEDQLALQAADVLSWHIQRYYTKKFDRVLESRMWMLLKERDGHLHEWERLDIRAIASGLGIG